MARYTYIATDNSATNGTALGADDQDIVVKQIIFGNPTDGVYAELHNNINPVAGATANMVAKVTQPTAAAGKQYVNVVDFGEGVSLGEGGNCVTNSSQVTVVWEPKA